MLLKFASSLAPAFMLAGLNVPLPAFWVLEMPPVGMIVYRYGVYL